MTEVWANSSAKGSALLVLLAVADFSSDDGRAYPSIATLAAKSRMSARNVRYVLDNLVEIGELAMEREKGPKGCNLFTVRTANFAGVQSGQAATRFPKGVQPASGGAAIAIAPEPSLTVIEPSGKSAAAGAAVAKPTVSPCPHLEIVDAYNRLLPTGRRVIPTLWNGTRAKHLQARWKEDPERQSVAWWESFFEHCGKSAFLTGQALPTPGRKPFEVSLGWIVEPENFVKIYEGAYD